MGFTNTPYIFTFFFYNQNHNPVHLIDFQQPANSPGVTFFLVNEGPDNPWDYSWHTFVNVQSVNLQVTSLWWPHSHTASTRNTTKRHTNQPVFQFPKSNYLSLPQFRNTNREQHIKHLTNDQILTAWLATITMFRDKNWYFCFRAESNQEILFNRVKNSYRTLLCENTYGGVGVGGVAMWNLEKQKANSK